MCGRVAGAYFYNSLASQKIKHLLFGQFTKFSHFYSVSLQNSVTILFSQFSASLQIQLLFIQSVHKIFSWRQEILICLLNNIFSRFAKFQFRKRREKRRENTD